MRKRLLLCYSLTIFMLFSFVRCSQEILDVQDNLGTFTKEARLYFEQNASDIQTVRVGNQKESLSRSMALSSRVITPSWEEGESIKRGAISSLEIPLTGDVYVKSFYSSTRDGLPSLSNVQTKLVIQKHDELKEMRSFVVTIIAAKRYEIMHAQSTQTFSFLNPNNFSGLMIVSDLEGNYLDAFQFTDGKQQRVALASASEEKDIKPDDVISTFALMDANSAGMYSRSGEGGGGGGTPVTPGELPEVEVWPICPKCHLPINQCSGHYTPPPTQWYCPYCHSPYCPGTCYTGGGGGNNPGSGSTSSSPSSLENYIGKDNYYLKRIEDFKKRNPNATVPDYYKNYGDFYLHEFKDKTYNLLSSQGKEWCIKTLENLQREMSNLLINNPKLELNNEAFMEAAFKTHVKAYCDAGITQLSILDKAMIFTTVYPSDLFTPNGLDQVASVSAEQIKTYKQNPAFALEQARDLSQSWDIYKALIITYLQEKDKTDPRKNNLRSRSVTNISDPNELMRLYFGESVEYFKATFGNQFTFPI